MLECHYGVPMAGAVLNTINTRLDAAVDRLPARPRRSQGADRRPRVLQAGEGGAGARQGEAAGDRLRRPGIHRRRRAAGHDRIRGVHRRRRCGLRLEHAGRRMGRDCAQLHLRHHRRSQGRRLSPPRRVLCSRSATCSPASMGKHPVYLWTLPMFHCNGWCFPWTISVVAGTHVCLRQVRARADVRRHRRPQGDASVRRADRDGDPAQRAGRGEEAAAACGRVRHRGGAAARGRAGGDEGGGLQRHPSLWADRDLRPRHRQRVADGLGRAAGGRAGRQEGAPGRALRAARSARRARSRHHGAGAARRRDAWAR